MKAWNKMTDLRQPTYEYKIVDLDAYAIPEKALNDLGIEGWRAIAFEGDVVLMERKVSRPVKPKEEK